ncbi:hypothetical protein PF010_g4312 [Phytophthora fragariae]|uniref:Uncharacterized protein n=2 Tax=Phytophthora TaxID=4783 RepID=A0A6A3FVR9_9STRA|nr:hypothetical protein PF009_g1906 [Phytophthora fragariae]KAE8999539.1 hypothetical protein PR001_g19031 [Phytophthora rubi]KAE9122649.1 hypothetical protein PF007_g7374 [Phytophthora fragariae]KAE9128936.1 hypothetical protein PF010_g4312 [Phytophthora fragariae]KAE9253531.1 hypothetical protein PF004_g1468 [Phytophthora fragariae]
MASLHSPIPTASVCHRKGANIGVARAARHLVVQTAGAMLLDELAAAKFELLYSNDV